MSHLNLEALARLVDEAPTPHEAAHLGTCDACRAELDAMRDDVQALAMLPDVAPAPDAWAALERRLTGEGVIRPQTRIPATSRYLQIAAALLLFLAGSVAGRLSTGTTEQQLAQAPQPAPPAAPQTAGPAATVPHTDDQQAQRLAVDEMAPTPVPPRAASLAQPPRQSPISFASNGGGRLTEPRTIAEAAELLRQTEELYLGALTRYAELTTQSDAGDPIARLAAFQSIVLTTQAALSQTPSDPVINGAHLTALAQRDAALRQVAASTSERWH
jgi:hypothetical protein